MNKVIIISLVVILTLMGCFAVFWFDTQPVQVVDKVVMPGPSKQLPSKNRRIIEFIEANGQSLAPTYSEAVCTEFVIKVINKVVPLTKAEMKDIRIITNLELDSLIAVDSPIIRGVQTALVKGGKGKEIKEGSEVLAGDFVQFWNVFQGKAYGHCGIVLEIEPNRRIRMYSSHPVTRGYGKQEFLWPERIYFARLN